MHGTAAAADQRDLEAAARTPAAKLQPPLLPEAFVAREPLSMLLEQWSGRRLTVVTAGPGYGKSSLLAAWATETGSCWYAIDESDRSLVAFARGLGASLSGRLPGLPAELAPGLGVAAATPAAEHARAESLAALLCERLERAGGQTALVLDDVQEIEAGSAPARLLETLCRQAPPGVRLLLCTRTDLPFPVERLRGRGQVGELDASALAFDEEEVGRLLSSTIGSPDLAGEVYPLTAGWPAGVRLAIEALRGAAPPERPRVLDAVRRPGGLVFRYLAEEVFANEPPAVLHLLRLMARFERVTPELCAELGVHDAEDELVALARRGFFVQTEGGEERSYSVHALVREFVQERWPLGAEDERRLCGRAARWFEERGELDEAVRCAVASGDRDDLERLLSTYGAELLARGLIAEVEQAAALLSAGELPRGLEAIVGEAHALRGRWDEALACYERALDGDADVPSSLAWRIGRIHFDRGRPELALSVYARGRADGDPASEALLLVGRAAAELSRGSLERSAAAAEEALAAALLAGEPRSLAAAYNIAMVVAIRGDPSRAEGHYRQGLEAAVRGDDVLQEIRLRSNYVAYLKEQGAFEAALAELEPALRLAQLAGVPLALAFALLKRGEVRVCVGELDLAIADFEAARSLYGRMGSNRAFGALMELGEVYRERGDSALARVTLEQALRAAEEVGDAQVLGYALANLARVIGAEDGDRAGELAERAVGLARESGHDLVFSLLSAGWVALARDDRGAAAARAAEAEAVARDRGDRAAIAEALELQAMTASEPAAEAARIEQAIAIWQEIGNRLREAKARLAVARLAGDGHAEELAARRLQRLGVRAAGPPAGLLASLPLSDPAPVAIRTLGGFELLRYGERVAASEWQSKKARDLLKLLVARRGRPAPRDVLVEVLWPDDDPAKTTNRLSVALSTVRAVLDPERRFPSDHFVTTGKDAVSLVRAHVSADVEHFLGDVHEGLDLLRDGKPTRAHELLEAAEAAYRGDFLEEDVFEDWAAPLREEARSAYVDAARVLADLAGADGDHDSAVRYRLRVLERDPYDERANLELVADLAGARRHGEARRAYQTYVDRMEQLGIEPAPMPSVTASAAVDGAGRRR